MKADKEWGPPTQVVFYTHIRPAQGQTEAQVIQKARVLGYTLVRFEGWTNADLGPSGKHGPRCVAAMRNHQAIMAIQDACEVKIGGKLDWPQIFHTAEE